MSAHQLLRAPHTLHEDTPRINFRAAGSQPHRQATAGGDASPQNAALHPCQEHPETTPGQHQTTEILVLKIYCVFEILTGWMQFSNLVRTFVGLKYFYNTWKQKIEILEMYSFRGYSNNFKFSNRLETAKISSFQYNFSVPFPGHWFIIFRNFVSLKLRIHASPCAPNCPHGWCSANVGGDLKIELRCNIFADKCFWNIIWSASKAVNHRLRSRRWFKTHGKSASKHFWRAQGSR